jgi:hypothetical protein
VFNPDSQSKERGRLRSVLNATGFTDTQSSSPEKSVIWKSGVPESSRGSQTTRCRYYVH